MRNLATLYAFLVEGDTAWMVMEFIEGESFAGMIQRRSPFPARRRSRSSGRRCWGSAMRTAWESSIATSSPATSCSTPMAS